MKCNREEEAKSHLMDKSVDFVCGDSNNSSFSSYIQDLSGQLPKQVNQMQFFTHLQPDSKTQSLKTTKLSFV